MGLYKDMARPGKDLIALSDKAAERINKKSILQYPNGRMVLTNQPKPVTTKSKIKLKHKNPEK